jgi:fructose-1-phosphate kinase PfkB-like protein
MGQLKKIITVGLNPTLQKTLVFPALVSDRVNRCSEYRFDSAGKGLNMSRVLCQLGKKNVHLTQLGGSLRPVYLELCAKDGIDVKWVESESNIRFCYTIIDKEKSQVTELVEEGERAGEGTEGRLLEALDMLLPDSSTLIIGGTKTAGFSGKLVPEMVRRARDAGLFVILDTRGPDLLNSLPFGPDLIKPNLEEFTATFACEKFNDFKGDKGHTALLCREIYEKYGCRIVLTRGKHNLWYSEAGDIEEFPVEAIESGEPLNTTGSGDAFTAGRAAALTDGASLREALAEGSRCGRLNAFLLKPGTIV